MTDSKKGVASRRGRFEQAHTQCAAEIASFPGDALLDVDLDAFEAVATVLWALPRLRLVAPLITQKKGVDRAKLEGIERYAYATAYVDFRLRALEGEDMAELHRTALTYQDTLCAASDVLPADVVAVDASSRTLDLIGEDLTRRAVRVQKHLAPQLPEAKELEGLYRSAVEAELHAELLLACLRPPTQLSRDALEVERERVFSLLIGAYEPASDAARRIFQDPSQADALARSYAYSRVAEVMGPEALRYLEPGGGETGSN